MIAYLDERPLNTIPRRSSLTLSELNQIIHEGFEDTTFCIEVSIAVEDTDCEEYGLTDDGYIDYPYDYIVNENVTGSTYYIVLVEVRDSALNHPLVNHLSEGDLTTLKRAIALLSE